MAETKSSAEAKKAAQAVKQNAGKSISSLKEMVGQVNPGAAKTSATRGIADAKDLAQMSVAYIKQETVGPLKALKRLLAFGLIAAILIGLGMIMALLGVLRGIQDQWGSTVPGDRGPLSGNWSWAPYAITALVAIVLMGLLAKLMLRTKKPNSTGGMR